MPEAGRPYPTFGPHFSVNGPDKLFSSPLATCRASWLRVRTRVATVTRLEAMYSHPIDGPINIASFRSGNPRPRPDLRLRSLNRNKGLDRGQLAVSVIERYTAFRALQDPLAQDWTAKSFAAHVVAFSRRKLPGIARRSRRTFAKATAKCLGNFFCALERRAPTLGATPARPRAGASVVATRLVSVTPGQEVFDDKVGHCAAEAFTGILIRAEMLARVDPAEASLVLNLPP
jgi:hypothetical protein